MSHRRRLGRRARRQIRDGRDKPLQSHCGLVDGQPADQTSGPFIGGQQCIRVRLYLLPADADYPRQHIYLPLALRNYTPPQWKSALVDHDGDPGQYTSVAIDPSSGHSHISYDDAANGDLRLVDYVGAGGACGPENDWRCGDVKSTI